MGDGQIFLKGIMSPVDYFFKAYTVKNAVKLLGAFRPDVEKIQYH
jgi:hypothetical protein